MIARYGQLANLFLKVSDLLLMLCALSLAIVLNYAPEARVPLSEYALDFLSTRVKIANALLGAAMAARLVCGVQPAGNLSFAPAQQIHRRAQGDWPRSFPGLADAVDGGANRTLANHNALDRNLCGADRAGAHRHHASFAASQPATATTARTQHQDAPDCRRRPTRALVCQRSKTSAAILAIASLATLTTKQTSMDMA